MAKRFLRAREVEDSTGLAHSKVYEAIKFGRLPPPIKVNGQHGSAWLTAEVEAVMKLRISGAGNEAIRRLVGELLLDRGWTHEAVAEYAAKADAAIAKKPAISILAKQAVRRTKGGAAPRPVVQEKGTAPGSKPTPQPTTTST